MPTNSEQSKLRRDVYQFLANNGFKMDSKTQGELSHLLQDVYESRVTDHVCPSSITEMTHEILCPQCGGKKTLKGHQRWKAFRKKKDITAEDIKSYPTPKEQ